MENKKPLLSFVMPVYNDGDTVRRAIESILDQDWPEKEVIAINDGSKDNTREVLNKLARNHKNLKVIHLEKNQGACQARNLGTKQAKGKYYAFLPADSFMYPGMARVWVETLERYPEYDFMYGGYRFVDYDGNQIPSGNYISEPFDPYLLTVRNYIDGSFPIRAETYWKVAEKIGQPDGVWDVNIISLQDWDYWLSVVKDYGGKGLYYQDIFFETYVPHAGGLSEDSHKNWIARSNAIKIKHGIPNRKICVTGPGASFFARYLAYILDADFQEMPPYKPHEYDMIYEIGFYPSIAEKCGMVFVEPRAMESYETLMQAGKGVPYTSAVKVIHLVGTDLLQMRDGLNKTELAVYQNTINNVIDHVFTEVDFTQKEAKALGLKTKILPIPPRRYFNTDPLPKDFTVAVYAPAINQALYNRELMVAVANKLPNIKFRFFGDHDRVGVEGENKNIQNVGYIRDMATFIKECSCLLRITEHDGLPQSVLEFLSAGRRVIFNHKFKFVNNPPKTVKGIVNAIKQEKKEKLNLKSAAWIRKAFNKDVFKKQIYALLKYRPKEFWNKKAEWWTKNVDKYYGELDKMGLVEIKNVLKKLPHKSVIDIGCGIGQWNNALDCKEYLGIDISSKLIKEARKRYPGREFKVSSLENFETAKRFDLAFCYTVFEHIHEEDMPNAIKSLKKIARKAIIIEPEDIKTKNYCINHNYDKWFKINKKVEINSSFGKRVLMVAEL